MPRETLQRLLDLELPLHFISGNGERAVLAQKKGEDPGVPEQAREAVRWVADQLTEEDQLLLASWPETLTLKAAGIGEVLFCHATPRNDHECFTRLTAEEKLLPVFAGLTADVVVCGHTHMQFDRTVGRLRVVNAGSVGMPFGEPGAYWLLLDAEVQLRRTNYDLAQASEAVRATSYPGAEHFATSNILSPPTEQRMLELFSKAELR